MTFYKGFSPKRANRIALIVELINEKLITLGKTRIESGWGSYTVMSLIVEDGRVLGVKLKDKNGESVVADDRFLNTRSFRTAPPISPLNLSESFMD